MTAEARVGQPGSRRPPAMRAVTVGPGIHGASPAESPPASDRRHSQLNRGTSPPRGRDTESLAGLGLAPAIRLTHTTGMARGLNSKTSSRSGSASRSYVARWAAVGSAYRPGRLCGARASRKRSCGRLGPPSLGASGGGRGLRRTRPTLHERDRSPVLPLPARCRASHPGNAGGKTPIGLRCVSALGEGSPLSGCPVAPCSVAPKASISAA